MIRPATTQDATALARVHVQAWQESYAGLLPDAVIAEHSIASRTLSWQRILAYAALPGSSFVCVAEMDGLIVGFASCGAQRDDRLRAEGYTGEITALYLLRSAQRRGFGRWMLAVLAQHLMARDHAAASLWVLEGNAPARAFYERLGGAVISRRVEGRADLAVADVAYGWRDVKAHIVGR